jgi:hypothetical protein
MTLRDEIKRIDMKKKPTIEELQKILDSDEHVKIYIRPDGSISTRKSKKSVEWDRIKDVRDLASDY